MALKVYEIGSTSSSPNESLCSTEKDLEDEITREMLVTRDGEIAHPKLKQLLGEADAVDGKEE